MFLSSADRLKYAVTRLDPYKSEKSCLEISEVVNWVQMSSIVVALGGGAEFDGHNSELRERPVRKVLLFEGRHLHGPRQFSCEMFFLANTIKI